MATVIRPWSPPGPKALAAFQSREEFVGLQGPVGSGKTGTLIAKALAGTMRQRPQPIVKGALPAVPAAHAVRRARLIILKTDYRRLWENFIPSWFEWIPKHDPANGIEWLGSNGGPATQAVTMALRDGTAAVLDTHFMALGDATTQQALEDFFAGLQSTWIWFNELQTFVELAFSYAFQRIGRYPREADGGAVDPAVWADMNAPVVDHWTYKAIVTQAWIENRNYFRQPGAFEDGAENLMNLSAGYYERQIRFMTKAEIERKVHNRFGRRLDGRPVHEFDDVAYVSPHELQPDPGLTLIVSMDAGGSPAATIMQRRRDNQLRVLDEVVCEHGVGPERFGARLGALLDSAKYVNFRAGNRIRAVADPAAQYGADTTAGEWDWLQRVGHEAGLRIVPAKTNDPQPRRQAVDDCLKTIGTTPMFWLSPTCTVLRGALNGGYRWRKVQVPGVERYDDKPEKNDYSHVADALQYGAMEEGGYEQAIGRLRDDASPVRAILQQHGYAGVTTPAHVGRVPGRLRDSARGQRPIIIDG